MSFQAMSWVIENSQQKTNSYLVLLLIAWHARPGGKSAWPSIPRLAHESRLNPRTVRRIVDRLVACGELVKETRSGPRQCNLYSLPFHEDTAAPPCDPPYEGTAAPPLTNQLMGTFSVPTHEDIQCPHDGGIAAPPELKENLNLTESISMAKNIPTLEQVKTFWQEKKYTSMAEAFFNHHAARGWIMSNGRKVQDWHAAAWTWEHNDSKFSKGNGNGRIYESAEAGRARRTKEALKRFNDSQSSGDSENVQ